MTRTAHSWLGQTRSPGPSVHTGPSPGSCGGTRGAGTFSQRDGCVTDTCVQCSRTITYLGRENRKVPLVESSGRPVWFPNECGHAGRCTTSYNNEASSAGVSLHGRPCFHSTPLRTLLEHHHSLSGDQGGRLWITDRHVLNHISDPIKLSLTGFPTSEQVARQIPGTRLLLRRPSPQHCVPSVYNGSPAQKPHIISACISYVILSCRRKGTLGIETEDLNVIMEK